MSARQSVDPERLRAARQAQPKEMQSLRALAKTAHISHPTLSRLQSSRAKKRVNAATLERLADGLRVSRAWLTGEQPHLPYVSQWGAFRDQRGRIVSHREHPTADQVRYSWFMQRIQAATHRDLCRWDTDDEAARYYEHGLRLVFDAMVDSRVWRAVGLIPVDNPGVMLPSDNTGPIQWLTQMLDPWFAGKAYLNARILWGIVRALEPVSRRSPILDRDARRGLEGYAAGLKAFASGKPQPTLTALDRARISGSLDDAAVAFQKLSKKILGPMATRREK